MSRVDLDVYNEASGFMIASAGLYGGEFSDVEEGDAEWLEAVANGDFLPFMLYQDDPFILRVVLDEPLSPQEQDEWVGKVVTKLRVPDGRLAVIGGGPEFLSGEDMEEFTRFLDVPPGEYLAEVYSYLHGVNGTSCLDAAGAGEPLGTYFRRTRPGVEFPLWLHNECAGDPRNDPGHEAEWRDKKADYQTERPRYVAFLLRLSPLDNSPEMPELERGWIKLGLGARRPTLFPLGVVADHLAPEGEE